MVHSFPQQFHIINDKKPYQLCHAVIKNSTTKPTKRPTHSNSLRMHEQRDTFNGIDTCSVRDIVTFDFTSKLTSYSESRSIIHRPDKNALINQLAKLKVFKILV